MKPNPTKPVRRAPASQRAEPRAEPLAERIRHWLLAGLVAVCVARPLVPSEGVSWLGDGHAFTMILLMLTSGYLLVLMHTRTLTRKLNIVDGAVALLVLFCVGSALLGILSNVGAANNAEFNGRQSSPRLALNMAWEWIGLGLTYFLTRQLPTTRLETRGLLAVMIALSGALAVLGLYQIAVTLPAERAAYAANPDAVLEALGQTFPVGSPERMRFEARLASSEPLATFALTNSLAGVLATWLIVGLGVTWCVVQAVRRGSQDALSIMRLLGIVAALLVVAVCLALTQSRSAFVALAAGLLLLPLAIAPQQLWQRARWVLAAGAACALLGILALLVGGRDSALAGAAAKSLGYRFEYWQSTLDMIANFPVLGIGPGEFQNYYTQYKLPGASEEIRDPHNFVLEVWATGGTLAFLALVSVFAGLALATFEAAKAPPDESTSEPVSKDSLRLMLLGAVVGLPLAFAIGVPFDFILSTEQLVLSAVSGAVVMAGLWEWVHRGRLPVLLPALGVTVMCIHLLAAGGMTYPGVAGSLWLLVAIAVNQRSLPVPAETSVIGSSAGPFRRLLPAMALGTSITAAIACYVTAFLPVLSHRAAMARAANTSLSDENRLNAMNDAIAADPYSVSPWLARAQLSAQRLAENPRDEQWQKRFAEAAQATVTLDGHSSATAREMLYLVGELYAKSPSKTVAGLLLKFSRHAVKLYPTSPQCQAEYAIALSLAGETKQALRAADRALELDHQTPHVDKKLSDKMRNELVNLQENAKESNDSPTDSKPVK